jgi:RNA polymerase sigma factor (sigma-70 family)
LYGTVRELTVAIASGNTEAFTHLFRERFSDMFADARRATGRDESFCLDVVQDAMIRVIRSMKPVDTEKRLRSWLRVVVQSCAYDRLRKEARQRRWEAAAAEFPRATANDEETERRLEWLRHELAALSHPDTRLLLMRYRLGWTLERIGEAVGLKPGAVDGRVRRLTASLRRRARETHDE